MSAKLFEALKRIILVTGHYGSGKTEFSVSLAMEMAASTPKSFERLAVIDLDIANPYFRSRERREALENAGISVYGSIYKTEVTAELPALGATVRAPLEDKGCRAIVDAGGNDAGAMVLNQFGKYFVPEETTHLIVINANRPETSDLAGALEHIEAIETVTGIKVNAIVNNCHLLMETTAETILKGHALCKEISEATGKPIICNCYPQKLVTEKDIPDFIENPFPLGLYMRPTWLDR